MTEREAKALVTLLKSMYPHTEVSRETWQGYAHYLADLDFDQAKAAVDELVVTSRFFPSVAEIRELVADHACGLPSEEEAWHEVEEAIRRFDSADSSTWTYSSDFSCPAVGAAAQSMGGVSAMHEARELAFSRREFMRSYAASRAQTVRRAQMPTRGDPKEIPQPQKPAIMPKMKTIGAAIKDKECTS